MLLALWVPKMAETTQGELLRAHSLKLLIIPYLVTRNHPEGTSRYKLTFLLNSINNI